MLKISRLRNYSLKIRTYLSMISFYRILLFLMIKTFKTMKKKTLIRINKIIMRKVFVLIMKIVIIMKRSIKITYL
jgi:hypothetical protein